MRPALRQILLGGGVNPVRNLSRATLPNARAAIVAALANTPSTHPIFAFASDSTGRGINLATWDLAWPIRMASYLSAAGIPVCTDSAFGYPLGASNVATFDPRVSIGSGWVAFANAGIGGRWYQNITTGNKLTFTPIGQFDTVDVYTYRSTALGTCTLDIDGAASGAGFASINSAGTATVLKTTLRAALGTHSVNVTPTGTFSNGTYVFGWRAYDSSKCKIEIINTSCGSTQSTDWGGTGVSVCGGQLLAMAPNTIFDDIGINDWLHAVPIGTFGTNINAMVANAQTDGDCVLIVPTQTNVAGQADQSIYISYLRQKASAAGLAQIDKSVLSGGFTKMSGMGWMDSDNIHPNKYWHDYFGQFMAGKLLAL